MEVLAIVGLALLAALVAVAVLDRDGGEGAAPRGSDAGVGGREHAAPTGPPSPTDAGPPWLDVRPRRVSADRQGDVVVEGYGCRPGGPADLVITELGTAPAVGGADRVVHRSAPLVDAVRRLAVEPGLTSEPPGRYRAAVTCAPPPGAPPRPDGLVLTATFELTEAPPVTIGDAGERAVGSGPPR